MKTEFEHISYTARPDVVYSIEEKDNLGKICNRRSTLDPFVLATLAP